MLKTNISIITINVKVTNWYIKIGKMDKNIKSSYMLFIKDTPKMLSYRSLKAKR